MYGLRRMKRVTDPLDDKAKARIVGGRNTPEPDYVSSGSEHSAHQPEDDVTSPADLSELFFSFEVNDGGSPPSSSPETNDSDMECDPSMHDYSCAPNMDLIKSALLDQTDEFRNVLRAHVSKAMRVFTWSVKSDKQVMRRNVMSFLRDCGYNAAICKTKWNSCGGLTAGNHEFIDVVRNDTKRYFIDLDFASGFEIARPTDSYERLLLQLPRVFVGKDGEIKMILKAISDAAKRSLKSRGLYMPPWRKHRFMQNKWFGSYRRTANLFPATFSSSSSAAKQSYGAVKCRAVGFDAAVSPYEIINCSKILLL